MGLILSELRSAAHPYRIEPVDVRVWSLEELCYVVLEKPVAVLDDFFTPELFSFLERELGETGLSARLKTLRKEGASDDELLADLLELSDFCTPKEAGRFRAGLEALRALHPAELLKRKADLVFEKKHYGHAARLYEKLAAMPVSISAGSAFQGRLWFDLGSAFANLFLLDRAVEAYRKSWSYTKDPEALKRIFFISRLEPELGKRQEWQAISSTAETEDWSAEYEEARAAALRSEAVVSLSEEMDRDPVIRTRAAQEKLRQWKCEYRAML